MADVPEWLRGLTRTFFYDVVFTNRQIKGERSPGTYAIGVLNNFLQTQKLNPFFWNLFTIPGPYGTGTKKNIHYEFRNQLRGMAICGPYYEKYEKYEYGIYAICHRCHTTMYGT